jgi:hypothetical protein
MEKKALANTGLKISTNEQFYIIFGAGNKPLAFKNQEELANLQITVDYDETVERTFKNIGLFESLFIKQTNIFAYC